MERVTRLELATGIPRIPGGNSQEPCRTSGLKSARSAQVEAASLAVHKKRHPTQNESDVYGASDEARTRYLHLGKVALYQMSYTRGNEDYYSKKTRNVNT